MRIAGCGGRFGFIREAGAEFTSAAARSGFQTDFEVLRTLDCGSLLPLFRGSLLPPLSAGARKRPGLARRGGSIQKKSPRGNARRPAGWPAESGSRLPQSKGCRREGAAARNPNSAPTSRVGCVAGMMWRRTTVALARSSGGRTMGNDASQKPGGLRHTRPASFWRRTPSFVMPTV